MLIAQITDVHLGFEPDVSDEENARRLEEVIAAIAALDVKPDVLLATGDLADKGAYDCYLQLQAALGRLDVPVLPAIGNHDARTPFLRAFPELKDENGFVQYGWSCAGRRVLVIDTAQEGRHGGAFCARRAAWLSARLAEAPATPTLIALHHPPIETGIPWLTTAPDEPWLVRLEEALSGRTNVVALVAGHVHRSMVGRFAGIPVAIAPPVAFAVALEMAAMDPDRPDGRPMVVADPPGFALHLWRDDGIVTHLVSAATPPVHARYDRGRQPMIRALFDERPRPR